MATAVATSQQQLDVALIDTPADVRDRDAEHVDALAASIQLQRLLVPLVVRASDSRYELVAGFHRFAAIRQLGLGVIDSVPVVVRDADHEDAGRAVENIVSCRRRHETINADRDGMPTNPHAREWRRASVARRCQRNSRR